MQRCQTTRTPENLETADNLIRQIRKVNASGAGRTSASTRLKRTENEQQEFDKLEEALLVELATNVVANSVKRTVEDTSSDVHPPTVAPWNRNPHHTYKQ